MKAQFKVKLFADSASIADILRLNRESHISGITTNPTLMKAAGVTDYLAFARQALAEVTTKPISLEVFADEFSEMERQARLLADLGENVYVKIPATNSLGESATKLISILGKAGVKLNVTAITSVPQFVRVFEALDPSVPSVLSVFAGRIADTGRDPVPVMQACRAYMGEKSQTELLWASTRELYNLFQAELAGADIITVTPDILKKLSFVGKELDLLSLETVQMFKRDADSAGFQL